MSGSDNEKKMPLSRNLREAEKEIDELTKQLDTSHFMINGLYRELISLKVKFNIKLTDHEKLWIEKNL